MIKFSGSRNLKNLLYFSPLIRYSTNLVPSVSQKPIKASFTIYGKDGTAPPLIVNHALFGAKNNWRSICAVLKDKLTPTRKIFAIDARNHGDSPQAPEHTYQHLAKDVEFFLQNQNIEKACLLGHSMGGRTVMYFCLQYPQFVEKAIIVDVSPLSNPTDPAEYLEIITTMRKVQVDSTLTLAQGRMEGRAQMKKVIHSNVVVDFLLQHLRKNKSGKFEWALNLDVLEHSLNDVTTFPQDILSNKFPNKVLFIAGKHSDFVNQDDWPSIQERFPNSELVWVDSGHIVHLEQPEETIRLITNFLNN